MYGPQTCCRNLGEGHLLGGPLGDVPSTSSCAGCQLSKNWWCALTILILCQCHDMKKVENHWLKAYSWQSHWRVAITHWRSTQNQVVTYQWVPTHSLEPQIQIMVPYSLLRGSIMKGMGTRFPLTPSQNWSSIVQHLLNCSWVVPCYVFPQCEIIEDYQSCLAEES